MLNERLKAWARHKVAKAIEKGTITKPDDCQKCGSGGRIEAHHDDYNQPLKVLWLCKPCHTALHVKMGTWNERLAIKKLGTSDTKIARAIMTSEDWSFY